MEATSPSSRLSPEQIEQFLTQGHVVLRGALTRQQTDDWSSQVWTRLGYDASDKATWAVPRHHMPTLRSREVKEFAPLVWEAMCELMGGEDRILQPAGWGDGFIITLGDDQSKENWQPPSSQVKGWHKDGDFFRHFLDSPEQGLLTIVLWSDVHPSGGATYIARDSVPVVARYLAQHPEGVLPNGFGFQDLIQECHDFVEATGQAGDVYLLHPYMLHTSSLNALRLPRLITNPVVKLKEPMQFHRADNNYSPVEQAILRGLGVPYFDFAATAPREALVPQRVLNQRKTREDELARLASAGMPVAASG